MAFDDRSDMINDRDLASFIDLIPSLETLDCQPRCGGGPTCVDHLDFNSCLGEGEAQNQACFWSCE